MNREFKFDVQKVSDTGEFWGVAAVYGTVDLGGDIIERGAFTKTLGDNGGRVPLLLEHRIPIGISNLQDSEVGLQTHGILNLEKEVAREAHSDLKFYQAQGKPYGMSIGYEATKKRKEGDIRILKEIRLGETSLTLSPMHPTARVSSVKSDELRQLIEKQDYLAIKALIDDESTELAGPESRYLIGSLSALLIKAAGTLSGAANTAEETGAAQAEPENDLHSWLPEFWQSWK